MELSHQEAMIDGHSSVFSSERAVRMEMSASSRTSPVRVARASMQTFSVPPFPFAPICHKHPHSHNISPFPFFHSSISQSILHTLDPSDRPFNRSNINTMAQNIEPRKNSHIEGELLCVSLPGIEAMADLSEPLAKFPYLRRCIGDGATLGFLSSQSQSLVPFPDPMSQTAMSEIFASPFIVLTMLSFP